MSLEITINGKIKDAMLAKDQAALRALRAIKSAILLEKTSRGGADTLSEETENKLLQKLAKQRKESIEVFEAQSRADLADKEKEELSIIESYLPAPMSSEELQAYLKLLITEVGASTMADLGKVMGRASKELAGKADGKEIATQVKALLA